jgi:hypothetical protein
MAPSDIPVSAEASFKLSACGSGGLNPSPYGSGKTISDASPAPRSPESSNLVLV